MAEDKKSGKGGKGDKGKGGSVAKLDSFETVMLWFIVLTLLSGVLGWIYALLSGDAGVTFGLNIQSFFLNSAVPFLKLLSYGISVLSFFGILWCVGALTKLNEAQNKIFNPKGNGENHIFSEENKNRKWERVEEHINSQNPSDWKFAILEADIILDELLTTIGYRGETMSDKLKSVEKSDFQTIDLAWEGHKVRNYIAHEGTDFLITEREARRVIALYRAVFEEFHFI